MKPEDVETRMGLLTGSLELGDLGRQRPRHRGRVREHGRSRRRSSPSSTRSPSPARSWPPTPPISNIDEIASATKRPESVIGMHFFSPANVMRLLEVVRAEKASKEVVATAMKLAPKIGKVARAGRRLPRLRRQPHAGRSASARRTRLVEEGAMPWDVDRVLYDFGLPMGPFAMSDLAGLDIGWSQRDLARARRCATSSARWTAAARRPAPASTTTTRTGRRRPSPVVEQMVLDHSEGEGHRRAAPISDEEILERCVYPDDQRGREDPGGGQGASAPPTSIWSGSTATAGRSIAAARCSTRDTVGAEDRARPAWRNGRSAIGPEFKPSELLRRKAEAGEQFTGAA